MLGSILMILVNKLEKANLPRTFGYICVFALLTLSFVSIVKGYYAFPPFLTICALLTFIFTKKSKFFGAHTARIVAFFSYIFYGKLLYNLLPKGESKWYGDCLMTDNGNTEVQSFFSLVLAFLTYYVTKHLVYKFSFNKNMALSDVSAEFKGDCSTELEHKVPVFHFKDRFNKFLTLLNKLSLPHKFGVGLFVICVLGHIFFGFTNAYLYNACEEYNHFNNVSNPVYSIYSWHVMDVLLFYVSVLLAIFSFKAKYNGALFVRLCTFFVFSVLNLVLGYVYNLRFVSLVTVFTITAVTYFALRLIVLKMLIKSNGIYGV